MEYIQRSRLDEIGLLEGFKFREQRPVVKESHHYPLAGHGVMDDQPDLLDR